MPVFISQTRCSTHSYRNKQQNVLIEQIIDTKTIKIRIRIETTCDWGFYKVKKKSERQMIEKIAK